MIIFIFKEMWVRVFIQKIFFDIISRRFDKDLKKEETMD